jgi:hypothetical protein
MSGTKQLEARHATVAAMPLVTEHDCQQPVYAGALCQGKPCVELIPIYSDRPRIQHQLVNELPEAPSNAKTFLLLPYGLSSDPSNTVLIPYLIYWKRVKPQSCSNCFYRQLTSRWHIHEVWMLRVCRTVWLSVRSGIFELK